MATPVTLVVCAVPVNASGSTLLDQCATTDRVVISTTVEQLTSTAEAFDYSYASAIYSLAFTTVVGLYLVAKNAGLVLALIRGR